MTDEWYLYHDKVVSLANKLHEEDLLNNVAETIYFFEKPWKWEKEWEQFKGGIEID